jgi:hypothetical protein
MRKLARSDPKLNWLILLDEREVKIGKFRK